MFSGVTPALLPLQQRGDACEYSIGPHRRRHQLVIRRAVVNQFAAALGAFGEAGLVDLIGSLGNYSMLAMLLNACQVDLQPVEPPFPDVRGYAKVVTP